MHPRKAFTLLELIVVIVILAILAAIAIPTFRAVIQRTRDRATTTSLQAIARDASALMAYQDGMTWTQAMDQAASETTYAATPAVEAAAWTASGAADQAAFDAAVPAKGTVTWFANGSDQTATLVLKAQSVTSRYCATSASSGAVSTPVCADGGVSVAATGATTVPGAPSGVVATAGDASASVSFTPPASNGGASITAYKVYANGSSTAAATGSSSPISVTGLTNGTAYTFVVKATNSAGEGAGSSASASVATSGPGQLSGWGYNTNGQLGNNSTTNSLVPVAVDTSGVLSGKAVTQVSSSHDASHACALTTEGKAYCWGFNNAGQLGNNSTTQSSVPVAVTASGVLNNKTVTQVAVGYNHACALTSEGLVYCWGANASGQLGNNATANSSVPVAVYTSGALNGKAVTQITAGYLHTCAATSDGLALCWGQNTYGQLGNNSATDSSVPVLVDTSGVLSGKTVTRVLVGERFSCAVASGGAYCWGYNNNGQLGNNTATNSPIPVAVVTSGVLSGKTVIGLAAGYIHACALTSEGKVYCWGQGGNGNLGNNSTSQSSVPVAVDTSGVLSGKAVTQIAGGGHHTCVVAAGAAYCWGYNNNGQLGNNSVTRAVVPVAVDTSGVLNGRTASQVAAGDTYAFVITS